MQEQVPPILEPESAKICYNLALASLAAILILVSLIRPSFKGLKAIHIALKQTDVRLFA